MQLNLLGDLLALCGRLALAGWDRLHPARQQKTLSLQLPSVVPLKPLARRERPLLDTLNPLT